MATSTSRTSNSLLPSDGEPPSRNASPEDKTVTVDLPVQHVEWLEEKADARDLSVSKVIRHLLKAETGRPKTSEGDASFDAANTGIFGDALRSETPSENNASEADEGEKGSLLNELKQAKERLNDMVEDGDPSGEDPPEENTSEENTSEENTSEENTSEENTSEENGSSPSPLEEGMAALESDDEANTDVSVEDPAASSPDSMFDVPDDASS